MGTVYYARKDDIPLAIIIPGVIIPMLIFIAVSVYCYRCERNLPSWDGAFAPTCSFPHGSDRRKSQQAEREYEKVKHQLENLEESVRDRCKKEFTGENKRPNDKEDQCSEEASIRTQKCLSFSHLLTENVRFHFSQI